MLVRNLDLILEGPVLVKARIALFYGYFTDILFKENIEKFNQSIKFLFESINYPPETIIIGHQACETLMTLIGDNNVIPKIEPLVRTSFPLTKYSLMTLQIVFLSTLKQIKSQCSLNS